MAVTNFHDERKDEDSFGRTISKIAEGLAFAHGSTGRVRETERLMRLPDEELEAMGIARHDIVQHVYRDLLGGD